MEKIWSPTDIFESDAEIAGWLISSGKWYFTGFQVLPVKSCKVASKIKMYGVHVGEIVNSFNEKNVIL